MPKITKELLDENGGKLPEFAWPGLYPLYYMSEEGTIFCCECANQEDANPEIVYYEAHWEGEPLICEGCGKEIESAYGIPEQDEDNNE